MHVKTKNRNLSKNDYKKGSFQNIQKLITIFELNFLITKLLHLSFFGCNKSYIESL